jgi:UDP-N-acetylmuramoyl-L-alanyl-D-glutamate--2,6-diaminopimelate ligase
MQLAQLLADLPDVLTVTGDPNSPVMEIVADSRMACPGTLFVAYKGVGADGHRFITDAIERGAVAIVGEEPPTKLAVPYVQVANGRAALAWLSAAWYGHPSRRMALVGVTGTDGKTTTSNLVFAILRAADRSAGLISTLNAVIGDQVYDTGLHTTTPDAPDIQRYLAEMLAAGAEVAVLEATSHGLSQHRVTACAFDVAVVTNITHEHLDFHGSYEAYRAAKALLVRSLGESRCKPGLPKTAVLNRDDDAFEYLAGIPVERTITYGTSNPRYIAPAHNLPASAQIHPTTAGSADVRLTASNVHHSPGDLKFEVVVDSADPAIMPGHWPLVTTLLGDYNVFNVLAAAAAGLALGVSMAAIQRGVRSVAGLGGRMERIDRGQDFLAIVDFAHTPNALARVLEAARGMTTPQGRLIVVFGSAGLRDRAKRRLMGEVAARLADFTVITAEDPRTEDLEAIMAETAAALEAAGYLEGRDFVRVPDRQRAILHAAQQARAGDVVIICGKGHEQSMCFGLIEHPWRDQVALAWALDTLAGTTGVPPPFTLPTW